MAVIRVDFDELMQFGRTYSVMSDSLEKQAQVFEFDASSLDLAVTSFGVQLSMPSDQFNGMSIGLASADGLARSRRVAEYLNDTGSTLYRHAGAVNAQDNRFDWLGLVAAPVKYGFFGISAMTTYFVVEEVAPYFDAAASDGVVLLADTFLGAFVVSNFGMATIGAVLGPVAVPVMLIVMGGATVYAKARDLADNGGFLEQVADVLGLVSGVIPLVVGVGAIVAAVAIGVVAVPYVIAIGSVMGVVALAAAVGSWAIDSAIGEAISNADDNPDDVTPTEWDFAEPALDEAFGVLPLGGNLRPLRLDPFPGADVFDIDVVGTLFETREAFDDIDFISRFGGTSLTDIGALDRLAGSDFGPLSVLSAGRAAVAVPETLDDIGGSWQEGDAFGVARDLGELVDQGATMASLVVPASGTLVSLGAKSFVAGLDIGDWIDDRTGFSDFAADGIYDVFFAGASSQ